MQTIVETIRRMTEVVVSRWTAELHRAPVCDKVQRTWFKAAQRLSIEWKSLLEI